VSRFLRQPTPQEWQSLLLEALRQRDAPKAVALAQRCVHRYGMETLETLLKHADGATGEDGQVRTWLFLLLKQESAGIAPPPVASDPLHSGPPPAASAPLGRLRLPGDQGQAMGTPPLESHPPDSPQPDRPLEATSPAEPGAERTAPAAPANIAPLETKGPPADAGVVLDQAADDTCADEGARPEEVADDPPAHEGALADEVGDAHSARDSLSPPEGSTAWPAPLDDVAADVLAPLAEFPAFVHTAAASHAPSAPAQASDAAYGGVPVSTVASAALDQAFAPLEIAFPPLPTLDRQATTPSATEPSPPEPPSLATSNVTDPLIPLELADPQSGAPTPQSSDPPPPGLDVPGNQETFWDDLPVHAAAPVPTFQVDAPSDREPLEHRRRRRSDGSRDQPAPISKALESWRAWLPGAFRSRPRP